MKTKYLVLIISVILLCYALFQSYNKGIIDSYVFYMLSFIFYFIYNFLKKNND